MKIFAGAFNNYWKNVYKYSSSVRKIIILTTSTVHECMYYTINTVSNEKVPTYCFLKINGNNKFLLLPILIPKTKTTFV